MYALLLECRRKDTGVHVLSRTPCTVGRRPFFHWPTSFVFSAGDREQHGDKSCIRRLEYRYQLKSMRFSLATCGFCFCQGLAPRVKMKHCPRQGSSFSASNSFAGKLQSIAAKVNASIQQLPSEIHRNFMEIFLRYSCLVLRNNLK